MNILPLTYGNKTATNVFIRLILEGTDPGSSGFIYYQVKTATGIVCEEGNINVPASWINSWNGSRSAVNTFLTTELPYIDEDFTPTTTTSTTVAPTTTSTTTVPTTTTTSTTVAPTTTTTTTV